MQLVRIVSWACFSFCESKRQLQSDSFVAELRVRVNNTSRVYQIGAS